MPALFEYRRRVADDEIDELGHANNQAYLAWMIEAAVHHCDAQGWPASRYLALGAAWVVRRHEIEYLRPALPQDELVVRTWVASLERVSSQRRYELYRAADNALLARGMTLWVWMDLSTGKPCRIPAEVVAGFEVVA